MIYIVIAEIIFLVVIVLTIKAIRSTNQKFFHVIGYVFLFISAFNFILIWTTLQQYYLRTDMCVYTKQMIGHPEKYGIH